MRILTRRHLPVEHCARGSISAWYVSSAFVLIIGVGIAVDFTGHMQAEAHAYDVAAQAARAGGQQLQAPSAVRGIALKADPAAAAAAARTYLASSDVSGTVHVERGTLVVVETSNTYSTKFLGIIGINRLNSTGHAQARIVRTSGGVER